MQNVIFNTIECSALFNNISAFLDNLENYMHCIVLKVDRIVWKNWWIITKMTLHFLKISSEPCFSRCMYKVKIDF